MHSMQPSLAKLTTKPAERYAAPMRPFARLPVFYDLNQKTTVVVGGSDAAKWKTELLVAAGANVNLYTEKHSLSTDFEKYLELDAHQAEPKIRFQNRNWLEIDLLNVKMAIIDTQCPDEAKAFNIACSKAGVPVNHIDKAELSSFSFGCIVNRSPVVIGISSAGAAPILAQAIRQKIETLLPATLSAWAALALRIRRTVHTQLTDWNERKAFWQQLSKKAFGPAPTAQDKDYHPSATEISKDAKRGRVSLVGAGPGDAELLTLKALRVLQSADVILFDNLVSDDVLELARREAKRILVGKRGHQNSCKQSDINALMVKLALAGRHVVRLKSGDPMIFGRAGEEISQLQQAGIQVDVIPGITAALAMAASLGISLTNRNCAQSVRLITGHSQSGALPENLDWSSIAKAECTSIFYMGGRTANEIAKRLLNAGMPSTTAIAICAAITRPGEQRWSGTLAAMTEGIERIGYKQPVLIGIGNAFSEQNETQLLVSAIA